MSDAMKFPALGDSEFLGLQRLMADVSGIWMAPHKRSLVAGRLMKRLRHHNLQNFVDYLRLLESPQFGDERRLVVDLLTTNETYFFREWRHFELLGAWMGQQTEPLRLWSAACSSGEEPYSLAMLAHERCPREDWSILASDLSLSMLERAHAGIYDMEQARHFPEGWLHRHCLRGVDDMEGRFRVQRVLRERVVSREINLMLSLPQDLGAFDVIFLRNILIYFDSDAKLRILQRLMPRLRRGGLLFIGHAESLHGFDLPLRSLHPSVYERL